MKGIKRTNMIMVCPNQQTELAPHDLYAIEVDQRNRNCYNCGRFGYITRYCRN